MKNRPLFLLAVLLIFSSTESFAQYKTFTFDLSEWPEIQVKRARDSANTFLICTQNEKDIIFYCNLVRTNGPLFAKSLLKQFVSQTEISIDNDYVSSLEKDLEELPVDSLRLFSFDKTLYLVSQKFAIKGGEKGIVGHDGFDKRLKAISSTHYCVAENLSYGFKDPMHAFMTLLIDAGVESLGHRKNILNTEFVYASAAFAPHKTYRVNMVMNFACTEINEPQ